MVRMAISASSGPASLVTFHFMRSIYFIYIVRCAHYHPYIRLIINSLYIKKVSRLRSTRRATALTLFYIQAQSFKRRKDGKCLLYRLYNFLLCSGMKYIFDCIHTFSNLLGYEVNFPLHIYFLYSASGTQCILP